MIKADESCQSDLITFCFYCSKLSKRQTNWLKKSAVRCITWLKVLAKIQSTFLCIKNNKISPEGIFGKADSRLEYLRFHNHF